jgi:hypothetical protein
MLSNGNTILLTHSTKRVALLHDLKQANGDFEQNEQADNIFCGTIQTSCKTMGT